MAILTKRSPGHSNGFISGYQRDEMIQKLGRIEHAAPELLKKTCDDLCRFPMEADEFELDEICESCPVTRVLEMIE